ncbi:MAG: ferritin-like domain-containing protein [Candidatus Peribacteraceae bacterium]|nr:ferritin-like domain-containing protein [Candidatus Peribacteraceae bacterium]
MSFFSSALEATSLRDLLLHEMKDLYDAEQQLIEALPKMAEHASSTELKKAFDEHLVQTEEHVVRLEDAFRLLDEKPEGQTCAGMQGLLTEGEHVLKSKLKGSVKDAALISAAQRVEHYEIAAYGTARSFAQTLGFEDVADLMQETLDEEGAADKLLTKIAGTVNEKAPAGK